MGNSMRNWFAAIGVAGLALSTTPLLAAGQGNKAPGSTFERIATFPVYLNSDIANQTVSEIVAASTDGRTLVYTDAALEAVGFVDIGDPSAPRPGGYISLEGEPTSVAVKGAYALVAVNTSESFIDVSGYLAVIDIRKQEIVAEIDLAGQPDSVAVSPNGLYAAIVIENERDEDLGDGEPPQAPPGLLQVLTMQGNPGKWLLRDVSLVDVPDLFPNDPEPEFVDINGQNVAVVSLQENNHIALVDLETAEVIGDFPAGDVDLEQIDTIEEDPALILLDSALDDVPREPDAVTWIGDDRIGTANEGDLFGGSRGFSIFDTEGTVLFDSGNALDHITVRLGHYPDGRSENKGNEPEAIEYAKFGGTEYLFVGSERSSVIFVYALQDGVPELRQVLPTGVGPEGVLAIPSRGLLVVASEEDERDDIIRSQVSIYRLGGANTYPSIESADRADGTPIPWGALSGLVADPSAPGTQYTIYDSFYDRSRVFRLDTGSMPARIVDEIELYDVDELVADLDYPQANLDGSVALDPEGIALRNGGGFWIASEGAGTYNDLDRPITSNNLIVGTDSLGQIDRVITLPDALNDVQLRFGFEGVAAVMEGSVEVLYVVFQRRWPGTGDPADHVRIGRYDTDSEEWTFAYYVVETPQSPLGGWVGLSDIAPLGDGRFAIIERDNQGGTDGRIKLITEIDADEVTFSADPASLPVADRPVLTKTIVRDLLAEGDLTLTNGLVPEKIEGLAVTGDGTAWVVNDNDGVDDNSGETQLIRIRDLF